MTYTNNPGGNQRDEVRFIVGDTDNDDLVLSDQEIQYLLTQHRHPRLAAVYAAEAITAFYARQVDSEIDQIRIIASQRWDHYNKLALKLRREAGMLVAAPYAGGISKLDKEADQENTDTVQPIFTVGMHRNTHH